MRLTHALTTIVLSAALAAGCASTELPEQTSDATLQDASVEPDAGGDVAPFDAQNDTADASPPQDTGEDASCEPTTCEALQACGPVDDGCGGSLDCGACPEVEQVKISPTGNQVLQVGAELQLDAVATATDGSQTFCEFGWSSGDPTIARVTTDGTVSGLEAGITDIRVECRGATDRVRVYVNDSGLSAALTDPASLAMWFRADVGLNFSGGASVEEWEDLSGNGSIVANDSFSRHPRRVNGAINDKPALQFTGNQELRTTASHAALDEATIFVVAKNTEATHRGQILSNCNDGGNNQLRFDGSADGLYFYGQENGLDEAVTVGSPTTDYSVVTVTLSNSQLRVRQNAQDQASVSVSANGTWNFGQIGARCSSEHLEGEVAEILAYSRVLGDTELGEVEAYLMTRYGL
ncbi:Ig-like domain-containing protein [Persicimonas caeni]|uniref:Ig-like domain-containing protein n=1 Tax=Persicimonas caeni TaxID=2292766 RepID=UPI001FEB4B64|nr:Ig-like domain-containing protein [Persicimonas caeni]